MKRYKFLIIALLTMTFTAPVVNHHLALAKRKLTRPTELAVYHNNRGVKYLEAGNLNLAEYEFKTAVELSPDYTEAYNNLGIVAKKKGDLMNAKTYFQKAIELDKNYAAAYSHLSMVYLDLGDIGNALSFGKIAARRGSTMPNTHYNLGLVYLAKSEQKPDKDYDEYAEKEFKIATELDPLMFEAHLNLARLYKRQSRYELSTIRYRLALEIKPYLSQLWKELGEVYQAMGDSEKAQRAFKQALTISKGKPKPSASPHIQKGIQLMDRGEFTKAIAELKKAVAQDPKNEVAHYRLGTAYLNLGDVRFRTGKKSEATKYFNLAIPSLKKALQLNPQMADASYNLGYTYYRLGDTGAAEKQWNKTLSIDANHARTLYNLGMLYNSLGDKMKTVKYLCRFAGAAGQEFASEKANALSIVKVNGGKCQN